MSVLVPKGKSASTTSAKYARAHAQDLKVAAHALEAAAEAYEQGDNPRAILYISEANRRMRIVEKSFVIKQYRRSKSKLVESSNEEASNVGDNGGNSSPYGG